MSLSMSLQNVGGKYGRASGCDVLWYSQELRLRKFMEYVEDAEAKGVDVDAYRACIADVSRELNCGAFSQGERFDNVQLVAKKCRDSRLALANLAKYMRRAGFSWIST